MKKMLMQFAGNLLSKEQMKVVKGGDSYGGIYDGVASGSGYCVRFDVGGGCGNVPINFAGSQGQAIGYGDHQVGTTGYTITSGRC